MDFSYQKQASLLTLSVGCSAEPRQLQSGSMGWFEVGECAWHFDWRFRAELSVTVPKANYGYSRIAPRGIAVDGRPSAARHFPANDGYVTFVIDEQSFEATFLIPDCLRSFNKSSGFGCAANGPIAIRGTLYHCGIRLIAKNHDRSATIERDGDRVRLFDVGLVVAEYVNEMAGKDFFDLADWYL